MKCLPLEIRTCSDNGTNWECAQELGVVDDMGDGGTAKGDMDALGLYRKVGVLTGGAVEALEEDGMLGGNEVCGRTLDPTKAV